MTDEPAQATAPEPDPSRDPSRERARIDRARQEKRADLLPVIYLIGFVVLAGAMYYIWANPPASKLGPQEASRFDTLQAQVVGLRDELAALRAKSAPTDATLAKLQQQVDAVANRPAPAPVSLQPVEARLGALENRPAVAPDQVQQLAARVDTLDKRPVIDPTAVDQRFAHVDTQLTQLAGQALALSARIDDVAGKQAAAQKEVAARIDDLGAKLGQIPQLGTRIDDATTKLAQMQTDLGGRIDKVAAQATQNGEQIKAVTQKAALLTRLQGAAANLAAGNKLGDIPGAPPALARFATEPPPTEAALRGSFDTYAADAQKVAQPAADNLSFTDRMLARAQQSVTVRQGDHVLVGDPSAGVVAHARELLDNGDLAGAVKALDGLSPPAAKAMQPWTDKARALLDARAALAAMAAG